MKRGLYRKLAFTGIRNNKKLYVPYILTGMGMVMMAYIISFLSSSPTFSTMRGGTVMQSFLEFGFGVMCVFSVIFLFYTNSFLIRRRKKEFGLYNILGMSKRNIALVLLWETFLIALMAIVGGLFFGLLFSKFAELGMVKILQETATFTFSVEFSSIQNTVLLFVLIYALTYLRALWQVRLSNPIALLHSENMGEKPPKANWLMAVLGAGILGVAYYIAMTVEDPLAALVWFFFAVVMVIVATYLLFMAGSVAFCRLLQKNKRYYYKTNHFVSVSSMVFRMKRNGAGLASICILCTMVLVMLSFTVCLYVGAEDSMNQRYPRAFNLTTTAMPEEEQKVWQDTIRQTVAEYGDTEQDVMDYRAVTFSVYLDQGQMVLQSGYASDLSSVENMWQVFVVPLEDYNRTMGTNETLNPGQAMIYTPRSSSYADASVTLPDGTTYTITRKLDDFAPNGLSSMDVVASMYLIVPDYDVVAESMLGLDTNGYQVMSRWFYGFDLSLSKQEQIDLQDTLYQTLYDKLVTLGATAGEGEEFSFSLENAEAERDGFYAMYGGLFFLGILLGVVFLFAAVLIIYYKQVSEGYEDRSRFSIMQKVGMTKREIRKSINSQILTVFFLPLLLAGCHLLFAFPMMKQLLLVFGLTNYSLLLLVTGCCYLIFALFYVLVYRATSRAYFVIVSDEENGNL